MSSMPLRIDGDLIKEARATGQVFHRSISQQIEYWASVGKAMDAVLTLPALAQVKAPKKLVDLDQALAAAHSPAGKNGTLALLARKKGLLYGVKPGQPNVLIQDDPEAGTISGEKIRGRLVRGKRAIGSKAATAR